MKKWTRLIDCKDDYIRRGSVLRIRKNPEGNFDWYPDPFTDFLIFDPVAKGAYGLMAISGHKSGMIYLIFPSDSTGSAGVGLQCKWLIENWKKWIYPDGTPDEAWIRGPKIVDFLDSD
ncbi:Imm45 family immunity protein [Variovorax paradoxus]|uniref:Imm45 family immunity protein n=1 Tax=Variovorax paradoxus TaxID=34073 RepID=UPI003D649FC0